MSEKKETDINSVKKFKSAKAHISINFVDSDLRSKIENIIKLFGGTYASFEDLGRELNKPNRFAVILVIIQDIKRIDFMIKMERAPFVTRVKAYLAENKDLPPKIFQLLSIYLAAKRPQILVVIPALYFEDTLIPTIPSNQKPS